MENFNDELGKIVDSQITLRAEALNTILKTEKSLAEFGVKFGYIGEDSVPEFELGTSYLPQFIYHLEEYEWEAIHHDGRTVRQYDIDGQHHYGHIDQSRLKTIRLVSNFIGQNDNAERRVILTLDWKYGKFDLLNGTMDPQDRAKLLEEKCEEPKKLILFKRVRFGQMVEIGEKCTPTKEVYFYKRYFLGYEVPGKKIIVSLLPNGKITII